MTVRVEDRVEPHLIVGEERNESFVYQPQLPQRCLALCERGLI
jgi:hypothetical protein